MGQQLGVSRPLLSGHLSMFSRSHICEFSIPVGVFVVALLLFPAAHGSFVATHGPVTALRSLQAATSILLALSALHILLIIQHTATRRLVARFAFEKPHTPAAPAREDACSLLC